MPGVLLLGVLCVLVSQTAWALGPRATPPPAAPDARPMPAEEAKGAGPSPEIAPAADPNQKLKEEQARLALENGITEQKLRMELEALVRQKQRLELENTLAGQKSAADVAALRAQVERLAQETAAIRAGMERNEAARAASVQAELADRKSQLERRISENDLASAEAASQVRGFQGKVLEMDAKLKELQVQRGAFDLQVMKFNTEIEIWEKRADWKNRVSRQIEYEREPFRDGVLTITDRRISLNGVIRMETADLVCERMDYYNNQSVEYPVFLVIDSSPGGSVMAGIRILKAMEGSPAPVYVVVKSYAASMAAAITTLAKRSFAYPDAVILQHELISVHFGNLTKQREDVRDMEEWWSRLASPIAAKMGLTLDAFVKRMYEESASGDWMEFADQASKLKWVDQIVTTIREQSLTKNPNAVRDKPDSLGGDPSDAEKLDNDGKRYKTLPRLAPFDCYYLYDPDGYYRVAK